MATSEGWKAILSRETPRCQREDVTTSQSVTNQVRACDESSDTDSSQNPVNEYRYTYVWIHVVARFQIGRS
jgi:hypothetical protein